MKKQALQSIFAALAAALLMAGCSNRSSDATSYPTPSKPVLTAQASEYTNAVKVSWTRPTDWDNYPLGSLTLEGASSRIGLSTEDTEAIVFLDSTKTYSLYLRLVYYDYSRVSPTDLGSVTVCSESYSYDCTYTPLTPPTNVKATHVSAYKVQISWDSNKSEHYKVWCSVDTNFQNAHTYPDYSVYTPLGWLTDKDKSATEVELIFYYEDVPAAESASTLYFWVTSFDGGGESEKSEMVIYTK